MGDPIYDAVFSLARLFIVHCLLPVFIFLSVYFLGLRDFRVKFDFAGFTSGLIRSFFK